MDLLQLVVLMHQNSLLLYPLTVKLIALVLELLALTHQIYQLVLLRVFALVVGLAHEFVV